MFRGGPEGFFGVHNVDVKGIVDVEHSASVDKVPGRKLHIKIDSVERNLQMCFCFVKTLSLQVELLPLKYHSLFLHLSHPELEGNGEVVS